MLASNIFHETTFFSSAILSLPHCRESSQKNHFDRQTATIQDNQEPLARASTFITYLARNLHIPKGSKSPLQTLLERSLHLSATEENRLLFSEITKAFFKQKGYFSRLFSNESWEEWFENRTALGMVASQLRNCMESIAPISSFTKEMNLQLIQEANEETSVLLKGLGSREVTRISKSSCLYGLTGGLAVTFLFKNPLPMLLGMSECFPRVHAQQKVGNEFQVNTYTNNSQEYPSVASFSNGNFVVTWNSYAQDSSSNGIYGQLFDGNATKIGSEFRANTYTIDSQGRSSVASFSNDNFIVTWASYGQDGSFYGVYGQLFDGNGSKIGSEFRANSYTTNQQWASSVASFSNGNFVVTWESCCQDGSSFGVYGQLFDGNGMKIGSEFRANTRTSSNQWASSVASFSNGNFVVTWESNGQDGSADGIYGQLFYGNGTKIGNEFRANSYITDDQWNPSVASFSNGNFVVTWTSTGQDGSDNGVYGQLFDGNATKIGNEFRANSYITDGQWNPSVASFSTGNFVVTWTSRYQDGSGYGVYGQLFDGNAIKIGSEFRANSYTNASQSMSSVASLSNGNFVVTWESYGQDGDSRGVYGQIFNDFPVSSTTSLVSSTTSTTKTTSSTTLSVSSSTMSVIGRTRTSVNSSSGITVSSTTRPITTSNSRATLSATSNPSHRFSWIWFLLGGVGAVSCLGLTGYFIFRYRDRKKDGDVHACALGKRKQTDDSTAEPLYGRTPDFVTEQAGERPIYGRTPDVVAAVSDYQFTPDVVAAGAGGV